MRGTRFQLCRVKKSAEEHRCSANYIFRKHFNYLTLFLLSRKRDYRGVRDSSEKEGRG